MNFTSVVMISNSVDPFTTTFSAHVALAQSFPHAVHQVLSLHSPAYSYERNRFPPPYSLFCSILGARS